MLSFSTFTFERAMKSTRRHSVRPRGISRIDQPSTRTHGWFVRAGFYARPNGTYAPRHRRFFGDFTYGGKRRALRAAEAYLAKLPRGGRKARSRATARRLRSARSLS
ncbi:MAG TPA: hypothetical protein VEK85_16285 [Gemmatimonadales bacterium]|nr:hypothetical protein [Gemmatimonadales bacterium]